MVTPQLTDYIRAQLQKGVGKELIKAQLLANGWQPLDIEKAFNQAMATIPNISQLGMPAQQASSPRTQPTVISLVPAKPYSSKKLLVAVFSIVGLLLIGGIIFAYPYVFPPAPEKVDPGLDIIK